MEGEGWEKHPLSWIRIQIGKRASRRFNVPDQKSRGEAQYEYDHGHDDTADDLYELGDRGVSADRGVASFV